MSRNRRYNPRNTDLPKKQQDDSQVVEEKVDWNKIALNTEELLYTEGKDYVELKDETIQFKEQIEQDENLPILDPKVLKEAEIIDQLQKVINSENILQEEVKVSKPKKKLPNKVTDKIDKKDDKPIFKVERNKRTKRVEVVSDIIEEEQKMEITVDKVAHLKTLLANVNMDTMKVEVELDIHLQIRQIEVRTEKIALLDRKIDNFRESLEDLKKRKSIIEKMIKENESNEETN